MTENYDLQRDPVALREALKWSLTYRRREMAGGTVWYDEDGCVAEPSVKVGTVLAIALREVDLGAVHAG
jgi:hypothetical protein